MEYDVLLRLMRQRDAVAVDEVIGRIVDVDKRYGPVASKLGKPDWIQDIQIETPDRQRLCVAFYNLSVRCFTGNRDDQSREAVFTPEHLGKWIKITDTLKGKDNKSCLKTIPPKKQTKKQNEFYGNKGIVVILKATSAVAVSWLVEPGQAKPEISTKSFQKQKKLLHVPGEPAAPAGRPKEEEKRTMTNDEAMDRAAFAYVVTLSALQAAYRWAAEKKLLDLPPDADFETAVSTLFIELKRKVNVFQDNDATIRGKAKRAAMMFIKQQIAVAKAVTTEAAADKKFNSPRAERLPKITQTCFIEVAGKFPLLEEPKKKG